MGDKVLIIRKERGHNIMKAKLRRKVRKGYSDDEYLKVFNPFDYNDLSLFLQDLEEVIGAPVEKAFRKYKENKERQFPWF